MIKLNVKTRCKLVCIIMYKNNLKSCAHSTTTTNKIDFSFYSILILCIYRLIRVSQNTNNADVYHTICGLSDKVYGKCILPVSFPTGGEHNHEWFATGRRQNGQCHLGHVRQQISQ